ncbi:YciI family protein [Rossellomorea sp. LjRoot5]|uniref:YciI family protein n=1 Tax=Rossellomorea sp. LjRoot5 TaxID=3342331 RepID=UPI003ECC449C
MSKKHYNKGEVVLAGPFEDLTGGTIVVEVENEDKVMNLIGKDPTLINRAFTYEVKRWGERMSNFENKTPANGGFS